MTPGRAGWGLRASLLACLSLLTAAARGGSPEGAPGSGPAAPCGSTEGVEVGPRLQAWTEMRQAKCAKIEPYRAGFLERQILAFEKAERPSIVELNFQGLFPRIQTVDHRSQIAPGVRLWRPDVGGSRFDLAGNAFWSLGGFRYYDAQAGVVPHAGRSFPLFASKADEVFELPNIRRDMGVPYVAYASATHRLMPRNDFFGVGPDSRREDQSDFLQRDTLVEGVLGYRFGPLTVAARAGGYFVTLGPGRDDDLPNLKETFLPETLPGALVSPPDFLRLGASAVIDARDLADNPHRGAVVAAEWLRYDARGTGAPSFDRWAADARVFVSLGHRQRVLALRAYASKDEPDRAGERVPFYLLSFLGSSHTLRAFASQRYRGEKLVLLQAEYRWEASPAVELAAFLDAGAVAARTKDAWPGLVKDVGVGLRLKTYDSTSLRFDLAWGEEGMKLLLRFSPAY